MKLGSRPCQVPTRPPAGGGVFAHYEMVADRVAGHLLHQAHATSFLDADMGAPVLQHMGRSPMLGACLHCLANAGILDSSAFDHLVTLAAGPRGVCGAAPARKRTFLHCAAMCWPFRGLPATQLAPPTPITVVSS